MSMHLRYSYVACPPSKRSQFARALLKRVNRDKQDAIRQAGHWQHPSREDEANSQLLGLRSVESSSCYSDGGATDFCSAGLPRKPDRRE